MKNFWIFLGLIVFSVPASAEELPIFDAHIHYSHDAVSLVPPEEAPSVEAASLAQAMLNFEEEAEASTRARLKELAASVGVPDDRIHVVFGVPGQSIRDTAESIGADLIVIGSHGRRGMGLLLGSTANSVLHGVRRDVLTVRITD